MPSSSATIQNDAGICGLCGKQAYLKGIVRYCNGCNESTVVCRCGR